LKIVFCILWSLDIIASYSEIIKIVVVFTYYYSWSIRLLCIHKRIIVVDIIMKYSTKIHEIRVFPLHAISIIVWFYFETQKSIWTTRDLKSYKRNSQNRLYLIKNTYVDQILLAKNVFGRNERSISFLSGDLFDFKCSGSEKAREYPISIIKTYH